MNLSAISTPTTWSPRSIPGSQIPSSATCSSKPPTTDYKDFGDIKFPTHIVETEGGRPILDLAITKAQANVRNAALQVPGPVQQATLPPVRVASQKVADGVWFLSGGTHNSILVEFKDYVVVVEAPLNEARSPAVIAEVKKLVPGKPIKYLINTHHHFDHSGGIRTYVAEGATVITNEGNKSFYQQAWKQPRTLDPDELAKNPKKPTFITYKDKYVLSDGTRELDIYRSRETTTTSSCPLPIFRRKKS